MAETMVQTKVLHPPRWKSDGRLLLSHNNSTPPRHLHVVPSMSLGGAERIVADIVRTFSEIGTEADVVVMRDSPVTHRIGASGITVHNIGNSPWKERIAFTAGLAHAMRGPAFCHLTSDGELLRLWEHGVMTVPVIHNAGRGWNQDTLLWKNNPLVPFVVACGRLPADELRAAGVEQRVIPVRHIVHEPEAMSDTQRALVRSAYGADTGSLLIGMTGRLAPQKRYTRAVRILHELVMRGIDARLAVTGAASGDEGVRCRNAVREEARKLGVSARVVMAGAVRDAGQLAGAYDVFLNTSLWEGVSISTMEAVAAGVPVVASRVGGQSEAVTDNDILMDTEAGDDEWADAILKLRGHSHSGIRNTGVYRQAAASVWPWLASLGPGCLLRRRTGDTDILFVTGNMDAGGAQRSLCNLAENLALKGLFVKVAVAGPAGVPGFMDAAIAAGVEFIDVSSGSSHKGALCGRAGRIMHLALESRPKTLAFWNMDAATKFLVAKVMAGGPVRIADVSPGPMLYKELDAETATAQRLAVTADEYVASLDVLVSKYHGGEPAPGRGMPKSFYVIPNGVRKSTEMLPQNTGPSPPAGCNPAFAAVTVGRLVVSKRPELLPAVVNRLRSIIPEATLTVIGGIHAEEPDAAWTEMMRRCNGVLPEGLYFAGPDSRTSGFLGRFACFYMVSVDQGCPNASLEAMSCGLSVVANPDGGTAEQVVHGVNGLLVEDPGSDEVFAARLGEALAEIMINPAEAARMGLASRNRATTMFGMEQMTNSYISAFSL